MLWLYDKTGVAVSVLDEYDSIITTERFREHSGWTGRFRPQDFDALYSAYFAVVADEPEVYLVEDPVIVTGGADFEGMPESPHVTCGGRSATALLHMRTIEGTKVWNGTKAGAMIADMMAGFTGVRALPLVFGTGETLGANFGLERTWGDCGNIAIEILAAQGLGMRARLDGTAVKLDVYAPADTGRSFGEAYGDGSTAKLERHDADWRNYAYVLGEGQGSARRLVVVDQTSGSERREVPVDARDLSATRSTAIAITGAAATDLLTAVAHGLVDGNAVQISDLSGCAPLANGTTYYVAAAAADTFKVSASPGGVAIDITTDGTGSVSQVVLTAAQYDALLAARGASVLAEMRRVEYGTASNLSVALRAGDIAWYDASLWRQSFMVTEVTTARSGGEIKRLPLLGEPLTTLRRTIRRIRSG